MIDHEASDHFGHDSEQKGFSMNWKVWVSLVALALAGCGGGSTDSSTDSNAAETGEGTSVVNVKIDGGDEQAGSAGEDVTAGTPTTAPGQIVPGGTPMAGQPVDGAYREAAVAGLWYPRDARKLATTVDALLTGTVAGVPGKVRAIIAPHAGYEFSGITAAVAYKQLMGQDTNTAIVLAPSHTATFAGASIPQVEGYRTPLGPMKLSPKAAELAGTMPFRPAPSVEAKRPQWWSQSSKGAPPAGKATPHTWEHSLEAQLPFLQWTLKACRLVPVLYGDVDPAAVAEALGPHIDDKTVVVASSDLSHDNPYEVARSLDAWCVKAVRELDIATMSRQSACGKGPILTVMHLAKERGWKPYVLDYRTSAQSPRGNKDSVVGYMSVVFTEGAYEKPEPLGKREKVFLLQLARATATRVVQGKPVPKVSRGSLPPKLLEPRGVFVTLNKKGKLRGCIGYTIAVKPLYLAVMETAANAAMRDRRFKPVQPPELGQIEFEVSVLTTPQPIYYNQPSDLLKALRPNVDGVVLEVPVAVRGKRTIARAVYLPTVWKQIPEPAKFMQQLSAKAGLPPNAWRSPAAKVLTFQAEDFREVIVKATQPATQPAEMPEGPGEDLPPVAPATTPAAPPVTTRPAPDGS